MNDETVGDGGVGMGIWTRNGLPLHVGILRAGPERSDNHRTSSIPRDDREMNDENVGDGGVGVGIW
eukprot:CAMPEP_0171323162 /NCGR_PEP_ID=MMETSP0816-20121228/115403_1 /TAXON_ID=420281 /ORGANISM="Proboscia inermis, Strain CCAP1064/1" /LENGTH=65 /DNA_ID=CAMNT_0011821807 /DNA_START=503 /DNA_END=697 /DNA_ORIENTATION=-